MKMLCGKASTTTININGSGPGSGSGSGVSLGRNQFGKDDVLLHRTVANVKTCCSQRKIRTDRPELQLLLLPRLPKIPPQFGLSFKQTSLDRKKEGERVAERVRGEREADTTL